MEELEKNEKLTEETNSKELHLNENKEESNRKASNIEDFSNSNTQNNYEELLKLVLALSTNFIILSPEDIDEGIYDVLKTIGLYAKADRSYVFTFSKDGKTVSNTHEWCAEGVKSKKISSQNI